MLSIKKLGAAKVLHTFTAVVPLLICLYWAVEHSIAMNLPPPGIVSSLYGLYVLALINIAVSIWMSPRQLCVGGLTNGAILFLFFTSPGGQMEIGTSMTIIAICQSVNLLNVYLPQEWAQE